MYLNIIVKFYNYSRFHLLHLVLSLLYVQHILFCLSLFLYYKKTLLYHMNLLNNNLVIYIICILQNIKIVCLLKGYYFAFLHLLQHTIFYRSPGVNIVSILSKSFMLLSAIIIPFVFTIPICIHLLNICYIILYIFYFF